MHTAEQYGTSTTKIEMATSVILGIIGIVRAAPEAAGPNWLIRIPAWVSKV